MDKPSNSRAADAAYDKAFAAFQEKSLEVARRWVLEALAHNRQHTSARALLARLDAARRPASPFESSSSGSEVISTDPTVLISRASQPVAAEPIEPTVMAGRTDARRRPPDTDTNVSIPVSPRASARPVADPTVIGPPRPRTGSTRQKSSFSLGAALTSLGERLQGRGGAPAAGRPRTAGSWFETPGARGALVALAAVAVGVFLVWGLYQTVRWFFPAGQELTIAKPKNGTIFGPGIECGTSGDKCSTRIRTNETVELVAKEDKGYAWSGFTGDCAPTGRMSMTKARTCGATFDPVTTGGPVATFMLTINKPEGGTIVAAGGILCGVNGSTCTAEIPSGQPVTLRAEAADGYIWENFTGDCPSTGETIMTSAKTCGAVFVKTASPTLNNSSKPGPILPLPPKPKPGPPNPVPVNPGPPVAPAQPNTPGSQGPTTPGPDPTTPGSDKAPAPAISRDEHAKREIQALVKSYCEALQTLSAKTVQQLFQPKVEREYKERFKEYKSLSCAVSAEPLEYLAFDSKEEGGVARLRFGMKQTIKWTTGGAPETNETIVTMLISRKGFQTAWRINEVTAIGKPKS